MTRRDERTWEALVRGKGLRPGVAPRPAEATIRGSGNPHQRRDLWPKPEPEAAWSALSMPIEPLLDEIGVVPLPPYIHEPLADPERYQTVYGRIEGSVAASTAGLHFTPELLVDLRRKGVEMAFVTLHIGLDTFRPVKEERIEDHQIHTEWYEVTAPVADQVNRARLEGRRVIAVGTTVVRALESAAGGSLAPGLDTGSDVSKDSETGCTEQGEVCAWRTVQAYCGPPTCLSIPAIASGPWRP